MLGFVNVFLIDAGELTLIDTGVPGSLNKILLAMEQIGKNPQDLKHILVTHLHFDHVGSLAALKKSTGAAVHMHPADAADYERGILLRPVEPAPGILSRAAVRIMQARPAGINREITPVDKELADGQVLDFAGGLKAIHAPGHTAGHMVFLWPGQGGVLFAADAASHYLGLGWSILYEDLTEGKATLRKLAGLDFNTAVFGHGTPIRREANRKFQAKF